MCYYIDHCVCKIGLFKIKIKLVKNLKRYNRHEDAVCASWESCVRALCVPWARCEHAAATACALWKSHGRCKDAVGTLCGRCRDALRTLCTRYNWQIWGVFRGDPTARWHGFKTLYKRCGIAVWCDRGFTTCIFCILLSFKISSCCLNMKVFNIYFISNNKKVDFLNLNMIS